MKFVYAYVLIINAVGFLIMLIDKQKAKKKKWRIPEHHLMSIAGAGGSVGVLLGMFVWRHKTKHLKFLIGVPVLLVMHILIVIIHYNV